MFKHQHGEHQIDLNLTPWSDRNFIVQFLDYQKAMKAERERRDAERQRKVEADKQAGELRLLQYVQEMDPARAIANSRAIFKFLEQHPQIKGVVTPTTVDIAISFLGPRGSNVLVWKPKLSKVRATPPTPTPAPVRLLDTGEPELPLDAGESQMRAASKTQLQDLSKRRGEGKQTWRQGWTGTNL
jgi:hypothetical protein